MSEFGPRTLHVSISVDLPGQDLSFESVDEMRTYGALPASVTKLSLSIWDASPYITALTNTERTLTVTAPVPPDERRHMHLHMTWSNFSYVTAEAPSEAWCAGIVEKTKTFARNQRVWYWFIKPWMVLTLSTIAGYLAIVPFNLTNFSARNITSGTFITSGTLFVFCMITAYIYFSYARVLPPFVLAIHQKESWLRKHATELTILAAAVSALAAIYTAFKK